MCSSKWLSVNETVQFVIMMHHFFFQAKSWRSPSDSSIGTVLFFLMAICCVSAALLIRINAPRTPWCCRYRPALHVFGARAEIRRLSVSVGASSSIKRGFFCFYPNLHITEKRPRDPSELVSRRTEKFNVLAIKAV